MSIYRRKSDGLYVAVVELGRDGTGRRIRKTVAGKTKKIARNKVDELRRHLAEGLKLGVNDRTTVEAWLRYWLDNVAAASLRPRTYVTYRSLVQQQIIPTIGQYRLVKLTPANVREMHLLNEAAGLSRSTVAGAHAVLKAALRDAVREQLIGRNVADLVDAPKLDRSARPALSAEQVRHFMRTAVEAGDPMATRWAIAFTLGLRQGEALGLEWDRVLPDELDLTWALSPIPQQHGCGEPTAAGAYPCGKQRPGACPLVEYRVRPGYPVRKLRGALALTPPKTEGSARRVPLLAPMARMLAAHRAAAGDNAYGLVWVDDRGLPIHPTRDARNWYAALDRAGLPRIPLHSARHTTATLLLEAEVPMRVISAILGHTSLATTEHYARVEKGLAASAIGRLDDLLPIEA